MKKLENKRSKNSIKLLSKYGIRSLVGCVSHRESRVFNWKRRRVGCGCFS
jgi:hypothetical protein